MRRQQHECRGARVIGNVLHGEHAAVAVPDHHRMRETAISHPTGCEPIVGDALGRGLKRSALGGAAVADGQDIMAAAIECQAGEAERGQGWRQKPRGTDIEIHRVAVEQQHTAGGSAAGGLIESAVERQCVSRNGDELGSHGLVL